MSTAETSEQVTIVVEDWIVSDQTDVLLNNQTTLSIAQNFTNNGMMRYVSCTPHSVIILNQTGNRTFKGNNMTICNMLIDKQQNGVTALDSLSIAGT